MSQPPIRGRLLQANVPAWVPLERLIGMRLADEFMWLFEIGLDDGTTLHAYRHLATGRYLHVALDGETFLLLPSGLYIAVRPAWAIRDAFWEWETSVPLPRDLRDVRAELARLTHDADLGAEP